MPRELILEYIHNSGNIGKEEFLYSSSSSSESNIYITQSPTILKIRSRPQNWNGDLEANKSMRIAVLSGDPILNFIKNSLFYSYGEQVFYRAEDEYLINNKTVEEILKSILDQENLNGIYPSDHMMDP